MIIREKIEREISFTSEEVETIRKFRDFLQNFDDEEWEMRSQKVKDLISNCMKKDPGERITIDEFLNHPWFKKNKKQKFSI